MHSLHCAYTPLKHNWKLEHSVEERKLRHLHVLVGMQELELQNNRDVHNRGGTQEGVRGCKQLTT